MPLIRLNIDGIEVTGHDSDTILGVASKNGISIPTLCHDNSVKMFGSCGICVVEAEGFPRLVRACSTMASDGMVIRTNTAKVRKSRKAALDLMLSDHKGDCKAPCMLACPGNTDCQGYVGLVANKQYREALELIKDRLPLPASIGRVCPHPCETACRRQLVEEPVSILGIKRFAADLDLHSDDPYIPELAPPTGKAVAIVGGGPGGLTCAYFLARSGHSVTIYDAMPKMGGMLRYGIPQYRLPKDVLDREIELISKLGVTMVNGVRIGGDMTLAYLRQSFSAVYVCVGAWNSSPLKCPGEDLRGVYGGIDFLRSVMVGAPIQIGDRVAVVGGGNTAMDACRTAVRLGSKEVYIVYRRTRDELPADDIEYKEAVEEGVQFRFLVNPIEIQSDDGAVKSLLLQKMQLGEPDSRGRRSPVPIEGETEVMPIDTVILAIGQSVNASGLEELELTRRGTISADENTFVTSVPGVFAGGDAVNAGPGIAIEAIGQSRKAAIAIDQYLSGQTPEYTVPFWVTRKDVEAEEFAGRDKQTRSPTDHLSAQYRRTNFEEVSDTLSEEGASLDAARCLECGCHDAFECKLIRYANEYGAQSDKYDGEKHNRCKDESHPFIMRDSNKCILCGLCVRVCEEVSGSGALGFIDRGFDTVVSPAFNMNLSDTDCISCGQCISVCPTGALGERIMGRKQVPLCEQYTETVCAHCSVGCPVTLATKGEAILRAIPDAENDGKLCVRGKFGLVTGNDTDRTRVPEILEHDRRSEYAWDPAILRAVKQAQSIVARYGPDSIAFSVSDKLTLEEIYAAKKFAATAFGSNQVVCFNKHWSGLESVLGNNSSPNTFDELSSANLIIHVGPDLVEHHATIGMRLRQIAASGKTEIVLINPSHSILSDIAVQSFFDYDDISVLKELAKALIDFGFTKGAAKTEGFDEFRASLDSVQPREHVKSLAQRYGSAKKAVIVFSQYGVTVDAAALIASIAAFTGHIGSPRDGIIQLLQNCNSQGIAELGILHADEVDFDKVRALFVFGEDVPEKYLKSPELLVVCDSLQTETSKRADVVLPCASFAETSGTFVSAERRVQRVSKAITGGGNEIWHIVSRMAEALGCPLGFDSVEAITAEIELVCPKLSDITSCGIEDSFIPARGDRVLYRDGFETESGKARLIAVPDGDLFRLNGNTNRARTRFDELVSSLIG